MVETPTGGGIIKGRRRDIKASGITSRERTIASSTSHAYECHQVAAPIRSCGSACEDQNDQSWPSIEVKRS
ncbi:hypothetical protein NECAME_19046 [Necator americanus]|uniref:Uncharacterized protein n=1 Tax=Necator americanus TaxID=51031 RepID=W2SQM6_NECAM|nr:hypothetical protein NECAME_19046 [Necator americanus]ETN72039.1 hypothetical protein NECAME_19046 [Necator americanus]